MPKNTRAYRCVDRLKKRYSYSAAIAICQKSTHQSYMSGRTLRGKQRKTRNKGRRKKTRRK